MKYLSGVHEIVDSYDGFVLDLWGVVHNGKEPYPGVLDCLKQLKAAGKKIVFLSNAPRRAWAVAERIATMGITPDYYDEIVSSGEETHAHLQLRNDPFYQKLGRKCYHIGTEKDASLFEDQDIEIVSSLQEADFILATDVIHSNDEPAQYQDILSEGIRLKLPLICANPDHVVHIQGHLQYCSGALAHLYEGLGGVVKYHGKPFPEIYESVKQHFHPHARLLAVGDSFLTDVAGAHHAGLDVTFIGGGIHSDDLKIHYGELPSHTAMEKLSQHYHINPTYVLPGLIW